MDRGLPHLVKSFKYIFYFHVPVLVLGLVFLYLYHDTNLRLAVLIILAGNLFLGLFTQVSNYIIERYSVEGITRDFVYHNFSHCFFRSLAGLSEIILYAVFLAFSFDNLVGGYLLLKTVSIWQGEYSNKKEWLHTALLRTAVVMSLLVGFAASIYIKKYINS